jgi:hypothetical protein
MNPKLEHLFRMIKNKKFHIVFLYESPLLNLFGVLQLMVMDVSSKKIDSIPSLSSSENSVPPDSECGIHRDHDSGKLFRSFDSIFAVLFRRPLWVYVMSCLRSIEKLY